MFQASALYIEIINIWCVEEQEGEFSKKYWED